ncbi:uncharacterized protein LY79DRAFT_674680 [Colletotrichum navitas]|uniref:Non-haem dioxygenase N-terminal domain-containing protein n=1 Tax=Colletotrichum navitas TaxID=681940 RepID=A0AAD8PKJ3_9PEZI|nr:uncharacterized protein LY79DRAFT_674680 [Colletotrichum navitas]KAK1569426.1 hypothetical protein LY79DRAFT_674680 [Colletotrichum navitas]
MSQMEESACFEGPSHDIANLSVISMQKLLSDDAEEASKLFSACSEWGFFCLDLDSIATEPYRASAGHLQDFAVQYFNRPLEEKMQDTNDAWETFNICGYICQILFLRANNHVEFEDLEGQRRNAYDWLNRKFLNYRLSHEVQKQSPMATGRLGFVGLWRPGMIA